MPLAAGPRPGPEASDDIFIAEDAHQRIYGQRLMLSAYGIKTQGRSRGLKLNYRTTEQNLAWAVGVLTGQQVIDSDGEAETMASYYSARTGPRPVVRSFPTLTAELDHAAQLIDGWVRSGEVAPETIAVLVRDKATRDRVVAGLGERGVDVRALDAAAVRPGHPVVLTMHRAKGTEFTRVLLLGLSKESMPIGLKAYDFDDEDLSEAQRGSGRCCMWQRRGHGTSWWSPTAARRRPCSQPPPDPCCQWVVRRAPGRRDLL